MSDKKQSKIKNFNEIPNDIAELLKNKRSEEVEYLNKSGYLKWRNTFIISYLSYAVLFYLIYIRRKKQISSKDSFFLFLPAFPMGYMLQKYMLDYKEFKKYLDTHIELNRLINIHINRKTI